MHRPFLVPALALLGAACGVPQPESWDHSAEPLYGSGGKVSPGGVSNGEDTDEADDAPGIPDEDFDGSMVYVLEGGDLEGCRVHWSVAGTARSTDCVYCSYTLDWAYDLVYTYQSDLTELEGDCSYSLAGTLADSGDYYADFFTNRWGVWAYSPDFYGSPSFLIGYTYDGDPEAEAYFFYNPLPAPPPGTSDFAFLLPLAYYGYGYGYYESGLLGYGEW